MKKKLLLALTVILLATAIQATTIQSIEPTETLYLNHQTDLNIEIYSDFNTNQYANIKLFDDGNKIADKNVYLLKETTTFTTLNYTPRNFTGPHDLNLLLYTPDTNGYPVIVHYFEKRVEVEEWLGPEISIESITLPSEIIVGEIFLATAVLKNNGSGTANNSLVKVFHGNTDSQNILYLSYLNFEPSQEREIEFSFTPLAPGSDLIIVKTVTNEREKLFSASQEELTQEAGTIPVYLRKGNESCVTVLDNGDRFFFDRIEKDNNVFRLYFVLTDGFGVKVFDTYGFHGDEFSSNARTVRIMTVDAETANVVLAYPYPVNVTYSTCSTDLADLLEELDRTNSALRALEENASECEGKRLIAIGSADGYREQLDICNTANAGFTADISDLANKISEADDQCDDRVDAAVSEEAEKLVLLEKVLDEREGVISNYANTVVPSLNEEIGTKSLMNVFLAIAFLMTIAFVAFLINKRGGI